MIPEDAVAEEGVAFFSQAATFERLWPRITDRLHEVFADGKFSHGAQVAALERELAAYTGAGFVIGVNSGTDALVLLLRACGLRPGDGVLVPAYSFVATASSVVLAGGRPQFVDIDPVSYAMDPAALAKAVTPESRFVMPTHLFHQQADMAALGELAETHGLTLVEDSAEGIGMRQLGTHAGLHGRGGVLSFFPSKTLGAIGDAGAVLTDDPAVAASVGALRHHGRFGRTLAHFPGISHETALPGMNSKMDDFQAAVLRAKLPELEADIARRATLAAAYTERLRGLPGVRRLPEPFPEAPGSRGVFYVYLVEVDRRDALVAALAARGVGTETYYPRPLHRQPCFAELGYRAGDFPVAEAASRHALALPLYPDLELSQVDRVCAAIAEFYTEAPTGSPGATAPVAEPAPGVPEFEGGAR
ncbi:DegT/DnrJ/EryC1/StrS family aminotransferase [Streptomyces sp. DSM 44915]|uniref:DegT/DnrJ/EryC1/StrS family aminotransferase n=1 Tax=Streptomyces chisholmiae TaxID=3075540 RepID=A0ABU2JNI7_9ACTN|nr:DegT/DnrJ/EryC1/StrS family aminotransferase [Streptomyces sp. DSM 44915]MDT0266549.1 DegT/DnrJ/EryC1/StrS family aminotransferase [Streptomyces sp. DSM 44915]